MTAHPTTNAEVLSAIFDTPGQSPTPRDARPWVCAFDGDPKHGNWAGRAWAATEPFDTPSLNAYFTLASFRPAVAGSAK
ncbi:MAG: hypothetical protein K2W93_03100, partial [Burkholderiaceae bacterium]|nr:hypothetical protein [Burkholderiaceae bacterium]